MKKIIGVFVVLGFAFYMFGGAFDAQVAADMNNIENIVTNEAIESYNIAAENGSAMDAYVAAGFAKAAALQAQDEKTYQQFCKIEKDWAKAAGMNF